MSARACAHTDTTFFRPGDNPAIVIADMQRVIGVMDDAIAYFTNPFRRATHAGYLGEGRFEIPLLVPRPGGQLRWVEGIHQVNVAFDNGLGVIPLSTSLALANVLHALVGAPDQEAARQSFDFCSCGATPII
ncbi:conserved hypothetical protein [Ricinus communis]|uniref:Uncharacterized protein n=1 Tax=Ricinus communis TaxID=3988 RepID=B9TJT5_RICCO|nr:conserved hypothetical protein [Ricinus communis]